MTRDEVVAWLIQELGASDDQIAQLESLETLTVAANENQNLISRSTVESFWERHILDSAQLLRPAGRRHGRWIDLGSGAGFPGLVVAILSAFHVELVEVRRKRIDHLEAVVDALGLSERVTVLGCKVEQVRGAPRHVISARAYAPLDRLFATARHLSDPSLTRWLLPKGRSAQSELAAAEQSWQGRFSLIPSITDAEAAIVVAEGVKARRTA